MRPVINLLFYSNFWIAACATAMILQTQLLLNDEVTFTPLAGLVFCSTLFLYAIHRIVGLFKVQPFTKTGRYQVISTFKNHIIFYAVAAAIGGLYFFWQVSFSVKMALIIPGILSMAYVLPFLSGKRRLRDLNFIKIFLVAIVWSWVSVLLPYLEMSKPFDSSLIFMTLERAFFIFAITLPFDIRDLKVDAHNNVQTIPARIGTRKSKYLAAVLMAISMFFVLLNTYTHFYSLWTAFGLLISAFITVFIINYSDRTQEDYFFTGLVDGMMLVQFGLVFGFSFL
jgi:1,4-dihydroxy-2-naphthoate octaprenyltransferase